MLINLINNLYDKDILKSNDVFYIKEQMHDRDSCPHDGLCSRRLALY